MNRLEFAIKISKKAGSSLVESFKRSESLKRGTSKEVKSTFDLVADEIIIKGIEDNFPDDSYLTEESGMIDKSSSFLWIIDPLDGTGNYENHNPFYSVSVSLWENGKPIFGIVEAPSLGERFVGITGKEAYREDLKTGERQELKLSGIKDLNRSYFVFCEGAEKSRDRIIDNFSKIYSKTKDFRKIGSAALELSWIASGRAEGYVTYQIPIWDIAAGLCIVWQAGGSVFDFDGREITIEHFNEKNNYDILVTNGRVNIDFDLQ